MSRHKRPEKLYRVEVRVGNAWVPANREPVPGNLLDDFRKDFRTARPHAVLRAVPVDGVGRVR